MKNVFVRIYGLRIFLPQDSFLACIDNKKFVKKNIESPLRWRTSKAV